VITALAFVLAAAAGALARAEAGRRWNEQGGAALGTLVVNVTGSFLAGLLATTAPPVVTVLAVGGLGTFTTFSSFAGEVVAAAERRQLALALAYLTASCGLGVAGAALGLALAGP
jgi:fluoride exporter